MKMQAKAGIDIVDDGEYGKANWANYILDRVTGFELRPAELRPVLWLGRDLQRFPEVMKAEFPFIPSMEAGLPTRSLRRARFNTATRAAFSATFRI